MTPERKNLIYRAMKPGEENEVCSLVTRVFKSFVAPQYSQEGIDEFLRYAAAPKAMVTRIQANHFVLVAELNGSIVGMIEVRDSNHISLFFVEGRLQQQGIAKELLRRALEICTRNQAGMAKLTVNSSPNAVGAYQTMGFRFEGPEQTKNGIRFVPMALSSDLSL